jgi:hypothetical protein
VGIGTDWFGRKWFGMGWLGRTWRIGIGMGWFRRKMEDRDWNEVGRTVRTFCMGYSLELINKMRFSSGLERQKQIW